MRKPKVKTKGSSLLNIGHLGHAPKKGNPYGICSRIEGLRKQSKNEDRFAGKPDMPSAWTQVRRMTFLKVEVRAH